MEDAQRRRARWDYPMSIYRKRKEGMGKVEWGWE
jgi:hypothetical protein